MGRSCYLKDTVAKAAAGVEALVAFLLAEDKVDQPVREFLLTATPRQVLDQLIIPIEWVV